ncbi:MAG TPA: hypothetical protein VF244_04700 [Acidimicrobiales bacterium]
MLAVLSFLAVAAWNGQHDRDIADRLRRDGVEVDATIVDYQESLRGINLAIGRKVKVVFQVEGRQVATWVIVGREHRTGPTRVRYLRTDPSVARLVSDPQPRAPAFVGCAIVFSILAIVGWAIWRLFGDLDRHLGLRD